LGEISIEEETHVSCSHGFHIHPKSSKEKKHVATVYSKAYWQNLTLPNICFENFNKRLLFV